MGPKGRLTVSIDQDVIDAAHEAVADGRARSVSALVEKALSHLRSHEHRLQAWDEYMRAYEAEHGEITEEQMDEAARTMRERAIVVRGRAGLLMPEDRKKRRE